MATDDIPTVQTATGLATDALVHPGNGTQVSADTLERWARAVTIAPLSKSKEENADSSAGMAAPEAGQPDSPSSTPLEGQPSFGRIDAGGPPPPDPNAARSAPSAPLPPGPKAGQLLPLGPASTQPRVNTFHADARVAAASSQQISSNTPTPPLEFAPPIPSKQNALDPRASFGVPPTMAVLARPGSPLESLPGDGEQPADGSSRVPSNPATLHQERSALPVPRSGAGGDTPSVGHAVQRSQPGLSRSDEVASPRALPLSALRGLHAHHHHSRVEKNLPDDAQSASSPPMPVSAAVSADLLTPRIQNQPLLDAAADTGRVDGMGGNEQLHALIDACCSRLWVNDGGGRTPQGVMLDLGRWMPGCTVEVAKAAGVLRITLRGVDGAERTRLENELQNLGDGLAEKLGCQVVAAVTTNKELT